VSVRKGEYVLKEGKVWDEAKRSRSKVALSIEDPVGEGGGGCDSAASNNGRPRALPFGGHGIKVKK
jgi:hypothetical protein